MKYTDVEELGGVVKVIRTYVWDRSMSGGM